MFVVSKFGSVSSSGKVASITVFLKNVTGGVFPMLQNIFLGPKY